jgi:hypothetical protein
MKALAWYSLVIVGISTLSLFAELVDGTAAKTGEIATDIYGIALYIPVTIFAILYLIRKDNHGKD